ncbi:MAG TPA: hypothetical protein VFL42_10510 [Terriglobales bacterium]|nr:hypothetical protein [Terriglobales bacterium]
MDWKRTFIYGSLVAGAVLFITGRRPAGLAIAGVGLATLASEHPEKVEDLWRRMPEYMERGGRLVDMAANLLERFGERTAGYRNIGVAGGNRY